MEAEIAACDSPASSQGTWKLIWPLETAKRGAVSEAPNWRDRPARLMGSGAAEAVDRDVMRKAP